MEILEPEIEIECLVNPTVDFEELYEQAFPLVARFVRKMNGTFPDAKDIFQDALIIYYEKQNTLALKVPAGLYILGIAKHIWYRKYKTAKRIIAFDDLEMDIAIPEDFYREENNRLLAVIKLTGRKCLDLLQAFYYDKLPLPELAHTFGYGTARAATVKKYKCLEKVRNQVKEKNLTYDDFLE